MKPSTQKINRAVKITLRIMRQEMQKRPYSNFQIRTKTRYLFGKDYQLNDSELREALHELRTTDQVNLLIANNKGYMFATSVRQMEDYMKRLHRRCVQQLQLLSSCKRQTEIVLGHQIGMEFYHDIYNQQSEITK